jgi:hypothetical protein
VSSGQQRNQYFVQYVALSHNDFLNLLFQRGYPIE